MGSQMLEWMQYIIQTNILFVNLFYVFVIRTIRTGTFKLSAL